VAVSPNTNPLTYNGYVTQIATMAVVNTTVVDGVVQGVDAAFNNILPQMLSYAEQRIQRDLDLQPALTSSTPGDYQFAIGNNTLAINPNDFVTVETISYTSGTANQPLLPASKEFLQNVYNDSSFRAPPLYFAMVGGDQATGGATSNNVIVGPYPDQAYPVTIMGVQWLPSLYQLRGNVDPADSQYTFISANLPDLLIMCSMIFVSAYQRNFGRESDDPAMAQSYENQYQTLMKGAIQEEYRKKFAASAWSSSSQPVVATPTR
jgi:hypothetical protein